MSEIAELMDPQKQIVTHRSHSHVYCRVLSQKMLRESLWEVTIKIGLAKGTTETKVYFDKPIEYDGRREDFTVWIRHADECEFTYKDERGDENEAFYFFILDVIVMEPGTKTAFQADHHMPTI